MSPLSPQETLQRLYKIYLDNPDYFAHMNTPTEEALLQIEKQQWSSESEAKEAIKSSLPEFKNRNEMWGFYASNLTHCALSPLIPIAINQFTAAGKSNGLAVDIGCGNSAAIFYLLERGWTVIGVEKYQSALDVLRTEVNKVNAKWLQTGQLCLVCQEMEAYQFPKNVRLIVATSAFSYCDPSKFRNLWYKMEHALESGGRLIGNFFQPCSTLVLEKTLEDSMCKALGVWFINLEAVKKLMSDKHYASELVREDNNPLQPSVNFIIRRV